MVYQVITSSQAVTLISVTPKHAINEWSLVDVNRVMIFITSSVEAMNIKCISQEAVHLQLQDRVGYAQQM